MAAPLLESLEALSFHDHIAFLCREDEDLLSVAVPYFRHGMARREKCLLLGNAAPAGVVLGGLRRAGVDVGGAMSRGALLVAPGEGQGAAGGIQGNFEAIGALLRRAARQARPEGYSGLRVMIHTPYAIGRVKRRERISEYQRMLHDFAAGSESVVLCLYPLGALPEEILLDALRVHPLIVHGGQLLENIYYAPPEEGGEDNPVGEFAYRLAQLAERHDQVARLKRQTERLQRFRDITASLLGRAEPNDVMAGIAECVISLGYAMCWIGMARPDGSVEPVASWGDRKGYLDEIRVRWDDSPQGNGPIGHAIRNEKPDLVRDVSRSKRFAPWRQSALARGFQSVAAFPLCQGRRTVGALAVYARYPDAFDRESVDELSAFALMASLVLQRARDTAALAKSEEKFRTVVENSNVVVVEIDSGGSIVLFNRAAEKLTGYESLEVVGRDYFAALVPPEESEQVRRVFRDVLAGKETVGYENALRTKDGALRLLSWSAKAVISPSGEAAGVVAVGVDVTDRRRREEEQERIRTSMVQVQKMESIGALAGGIAHNFNNLLGVIIGHASLMETGLAPSDPFAGRIRKIREAGERAAELTAKLLGFARRGKYAVVPLSLNDVVDSTLAIVSRSFDRSIEFRVSREPSLRAVEGDPGQMEQILLNLCLNARDAMPDGGVLTIETANVRLTEEEAIACHVGRPGDYTLLVVRDSGEGMSEEVLSHAFEPFYTTRRDKGRSGLGLSMAYGIVKNHGGGIHISSAPGQGTTVRIHLPSAPRAEGRTVPPPGARSVATVLIVDDEPDVRDMGETLLSALGYATIAAEDGDDAVAIFRERGAEIDLVLLDIVMPRKGGKETYEAIRKISPAVPILLSSGTRLEEAAQEILDEGADGFIQKPYRMAELGRAVRSALDPARRR